MNRIPLPLLAAAFLLSALASIPRPAWCAWAHDPAVNTPVAVTAGTQYYPAIAPDGAGGVIVTWYDSRGASLDIYAQRLSASGVPLWTTGGVAVCTASGSQAFPAVVADGSGGAILFWMDQRGGSYDVYAQRLSSAGAPLWTANGVALCAATGDQWWPRAVADGAGGAIVAWYDGRSGTYDIYAQRVSAAGVAQWTANGVALCAATNDQSAHSIVADGLGGAVVAWQDYRAGNFDVYAQRVAFSGTTMWTANGVALCTATLGQTDAVLAADGAGGAIVAWADQRSGVTDIYAQRVSDTGVAQWAANGVLVCGATNSQSTPRIVPDGAGGATVAWGDYRGGATTDLYAQRVSQAGAALWTANGVAICTAAGNQWIYSLVQDGTGGTVLAWYDVRLGGNDVYAQRFSSSGVALWTTDGVPVGTAVRDQLNPVLAADGTGGAILVWSDDRTSGDTDIYAQRVDEWGYLGAEPVLAGVRDVPNDQGGLVKVSWNASPLDVDPLFRNVDHYLVFRSAPPNVVARTLGDDRLATRDATEAATLPGRVLVTTAGALTYYWEYVGTQGAYHLPTYSMVAPTTGDSTAGSNPVTAFLVQAWTSGGARWWSSAPDSGYSVDNLAPAAPALFTGEYAAGTSTLHWTPSAAPDVGEYRLYRGSGPDFVPGPGNLVAARADTGYVDAAGGPYHYKLCVVDVHGNLSPYLTLLPGGTVDVPGPAVPRAVFLAAPAPNPARGAVTLRFGLPRAARVELALFDQQGRRVRTLAAGERPAGEHVLAWDARDEGGRVLPTGLYFVRLEVEGRGLVSRLAVIR